MPTEPADLNLPQQNETAPGSAPEGNTMSGQPAPVERCARVCAERAWRMANRMLKNANDADDAVQQALLIAAGKPDDIPKHDPWPWFAAVIRNVCFRQMRARKRTPAPLESHPLTNGESDPVILNESAEFLRILRSEMHDIPTDEREALALKYFSGLSYRQAARETGIPFNTLISRSQRGLDRLRKKISPRINKRLLSAPTFGLLWLRDQVKLALVGAKDRAVASWKGALGIHGVMLSCAIGVLALLGLAASFAAPLIESSGEPQAHYLTDVLAPKDQVGAAELADSNGTSQLRRKRSEHQSSAAKTRQLHSFDTSAVTSNAYGASSRVITGKTLIATAHDDELVVTENAQAGALVWADVLGETAEEQESTVKRYSWALSGREGRFRLHLPRDFAGKLWLYHSGCISANVPPADLRAQVVRELTESDRSPEDYPSLQLPKPASRDLEQLTSIAHLSHISLREEEAPRVTLAAERAARLSLSVLKAKDAPLAGAKLVASWQQSALVIEHTTRGETLMIAPLRLNQPHTITISADGYQRAEIEFQPKSYSTVLSRILKQQAADSVLEKDEEADNENSLEDRLKGLSRLIEGDNGRVSLFAKVSGHNANAAAARVEALRPADAIKLPGDATAFQLRYSRKTVFIGAGGQIGIAAADVLLRDSVVLVTGTIATNAFLATEITGLSEARVARLLDEEDSPVPPSNEEERSNEEVLDENEESPEDDEEAKPEESNEDPKEPEPGQLPQNEALTYFTVSGAIQAHVGQTISLRLSAPVTIGETVLTSGTTVSLDITGSTMLSAAGAAISFQDLMPGNSVLVQASLQHGHAEILNLQLLPSQATFRINSIGYGGNGRRVAVVDLESWNGAPANPSLNVFTAYFGWSELALRDGQIATTGRIGAGGVFHSIFSETPGFGGAMPTGSMIFPATGRLAGFSEVNIDPYGYIQFEFQESLFGGPGFAPTYTVMANFNATYTLVEGGVPRKLTAFEAVEALRAFNTRIDIEGIPTPVVGIFDATHSVTIYR